LESYNPLDGKNFALYAVDSTALMKRSLEKIKEFDHTFNHDLRSFEDSKDEVFDEIIDRFVFSLLWISEPKVINRRLDLQAGTFMTSMDRQVRIEDAISNSIYSDVEMTKYCISRGLYDNVYALLRQANISSKSIYGDLEGLGRSVRMELAAYTRP
jgi:hypothetical protein